MAIIKLTDNDNWWITGEDVKNLEHSYFPGETVNWYSHFAKQLVSLSKCYAVLPSDSAITLPNSLS